MKRDRFQCTYCGAPGTEEELEIDHVIPVASGGSNHISNLTTSCRKCNQAKSDGSAPSRAGTEMFGSHPLVGLYFHIRKDDILDMSFKSQGFIRGVDGENVIALMFSWIDGRPTRARIFNKKDVYSDKFVLYPNLEEMDLAYANNVKLISELSPAFDRGRKEDTNAT